MVFLAAVNLEIIRIDSVIHPTQVHLAGYIRIQTITLYKKFKEDFSLNDLEKKQFFLAFPTCQLELFCNLLN